MGHKGRERRGNRTTAEAAAEAAAEARPRFKQVIGLAVNATKAIALEIAEATWEAARDLGDGGTGFVTGDDWGRSCVLRPRAF